MFIKNFSIIGGYGTKPFRIFVTAIMAIIIFGVKYYYFMVDTQAFRSKLLESLYFSAITFLTIGYGDIESARLTTCHNLIVALISIEGFLGLFLMAYFTVAVVRKILR